MKSLMLLWQVVLEELSTWCDTDATLDLKTAKSRFEHEGTSFLTITLPTYCDGLQKALDSGKVNHDQFPSFSFAGGLPRFLGGFLDLVFDRKSGVLLDDPSHDAIFAIRQLTLLFKKILLPCSDERVEKAFDEFVECERIVRAFDSERSEADYLDFSRISRLLFAELFTRLDDRVYHLDIVPKHGPGATADKAKANQKYTRYIWTERLEGVFPAVEFLYSGWTHDDSQVNYLEPGAEIPVRVIPVPKTLKTPRIIAIEPTPVQYIQQGVLEAFLEEWKRDNLLASFLGFDDQVPNQELARRGSEDGSLATLDLSSASDRVSNQLVRAMVQNHPNFAKGLDACRSRKADVPGHGVIRLAKFASMGSATCFPVEAMVFLTLIFLGIERELSAPLCRRDLYRFLGQVRVFGDDIIVPVDYVSSVVATLESFGFKVNTNKSFWNGKFRESCGKDYYAGTDVSVVKLGTVLPSQRQHASEVLSTSATRNQFYQLGLWQTCKWMDQLIGDVIRHYPTVFPTSPVVGRHSLLGYETQRTCEILHRPLVKGYVVQSKIPVDFLDGDAALLKFFLKRGFDPIQGEHLERAGRPDAVNLKLRWAPAH